MTLVEQRRALQQIQWSGSTVPVEVRMEGVLVCQCPVHHDQDRATVEVVYTVGAALVELGSFRQYLEQFARREVLHEAATVEIWDALSGAIEPKRLTVRTTWEPVEGIPCVVTCST